MSSATVRISLATREKLRSLTSETGETMQAILDEAVEVYRRQLFLKRANEAFAALRNDPNAWKEEQEERVAWDITLEGVVSPATLSEVEDRLRILLDL